ncbi:calcium:proton antiporter [Qipengyuania qiaonensis]|uniref:Ionic transporter y4hA n=1 Tax=Qipengyuania qiaonensis TaxID=2867240 RepID=A0ABS7J8J7_9SPHN|nr:ionic transporter y4hA [Qipengyuania qiaonensis]MBX7482204.1 ionic transporter y4hA [Qipengyuania qiaonensis]
MTPAPASAKPGFRPFGLTLWAVIAPVLSVVAIGAGKPGGIGMALILGLLLGAAIMAAVYHAEILAHYLGEPFGTLVLAVAVTVIEVSLIVSIMLGEGAQAQALARDTLIAAIMITINGIVGICLLAGGRIHHEQSYTQSGVSAGLAMLATLSVLTLVLPNFTTSAPGAFYSPKQLVFVAVVSLLIYATFVVAQTIRHRDHFLHNLEEANDHAHEEMVTRRKAIAAGGALLVALVGVVFLAKNLSPTIEGAVASAGLPRALVGIIIAGLVLAPEGFAALRAARANRVQTSLNLAIGSALATIGLTIPSVAVVALMLGLDLELGLSMRSAVLLALTLLVATLTLSRGRTTVVQGVIHLVIFATYLFTTIVP